MNGLNAKELHEIVEKIRKTVDFFANFEPNELIEILKVSSIKKVKEGDVIFREGEKGDDMYIVVHGSISISKGGKELATLGPGACFGEMSIIDRSPRVADAISSSDSLLVLVNEEILASTDMGVRLKLCKNFSQVLAERLRALNAAI